MVIVLDGLLEILLELGFQNKVLLVFDKLYEFISGLLDIFLKKGLVSLKKISNGTDSFISDLINTEPQFSHSLVGFECLSDGTGSLSSDLVATKPQCLHNLIGFECLSNGTGSLSSNLVSK